MGRQKGHQIGVDFGRAHVTVVLDSLTITVVNMPIAPSAQSSGDFSSATLWFAQFWSLKWTFYLA